MSDIVEFLERMGSDARLRHADHEVVRQELEQAELAPEARMAILDSDRAALEALVAARASICCMVHAPEDDEDEESEEEPEDDESESPQPSKRSIRRDVSH